MSAGTNNGDQDQLELALREEGKYETEQSLKSQGSQSGISTRSREEEIVVIPNEGFGPSDIENGARGGIGRLSGGPIDADDGLMLERPVIFRQETRTTLGSSGSLDGSDGYHSNGKDSDVQMGGLTPRIRRST